MSQKRVYSERTLKVLWAKSGNLCAFPECPERLIIEYTDDTLGHICHIVSENGPRADPTFPKDKFDEPENLILMCRNCHGKIDSKSGENKFSVDEIKKWKIDHEEKIGRRVNQGVPWKTNIGALYYINYPRLLMIAAMRGIAPSFLPEIKTKSFIESLDQMGWFVHECSRKLPELFIRSIELSTLKEINETLIGSTIAFGGRYRTKNCPSPDDVRKDNFSMSGDLANDPQIYGETSGYKIIMGYDPRWLTTMTSFSSLRPSGGQGNFAGIAQVKDVLMAERIIYASPIIIGSPESTLDMDSLWNWSHDEE